MRIIFRLPILLILLLFSCSEEEGGQKNSEETKEEESYSTAKFSIAGEIVAQKLQQKQNDSEKDLFGMQFFEVETKKPYAYVVGDKISDIQVNFRTGQVYMMKMTYLRDGKDTLNNFGGRWGEPFRVTDNGTPVLNEVYYSSGITLETISSPHINLKNGDGGTLVEIDRYHGVIEKFEIFEDEENLSIELKRLVFGLTLNIDSTDPLLDSIYLSINGKHHDLREYIFPLTDGKGSLEIPYITLGFPDYDPFEKYLNSLDRAVLGEYKEQVHLSIGTPDHYTLFFDDFITVTRNMMTVIDMSPEITGETSNGGFSISFGEEMLEQYIDLTTP